MIDMNRNKNTSSCHVTERAFYVSIPIYHSKTSLVKKNNPLNYTNLLVVVF